MIGVGGTASGAVQTRPAVAALLAGVDVTGGEFVLNGVVVHPVPDIAQLELLVAHELVAGVKIAPRGNGHVFRSGAAAGYALVNAGTGGQVDHVVVEGDRLACAFAAKHFRRKKLVLLLDYLDIFRRQCHGIVRCSHDRLHAQFRETEVSHVQNILQKVRVGVGEGAPHIVVLPVAGSHQLLELGNDLLPAAVSGVVHAVAVVNLLAAVQTQHHVAHLTIGEVDHVNIDEHTVCGQRKAEIFAPLLFHTAGILHQLLHHVPVHQRLAAEEVYLQIVTGAGVFNEEIQRPLAHLIAHQGAVAMVLALTGEAVGAVEVAGMGNVQAQRLDHAGGARLQLARHRLEGILGEQLASRLQLRDLVIALAHLLRRDALGGVVLFGQLTDDGVAALALEHGDDVIGQLVHRVDRAGADVQHDVIAAQVVLMDHISKFPSR